MAFLGPAHIMSHSFNHTNNVLDDYKGVMLISCTLVDAGATLGHR